jgi:uncharacterized protein (TIGR02996 family)
MSADKLAMHAAMLAADPRDDLAPLLYADWLEDQERVAQADFLRVQRKLMQLPGGAPEESALLDRRNKLFGSVRSWYDFPAEWYVSAKMRSDGKRYILEWLRATVLDPTQYLLGFVSQAVLTYQHFFELAEPLMRFQPVRHLTLRLESPDLSYSPVTLEEVERLADSPLLMHVTSLSASSVHLSALAALMKSRHLGRLRELRTSSAGVETIEAILGSPSCFELEVLELSGIEDHGVAEQNNPMANRVAQTIAESSRMSSLRYLGIHRGLGPTGARALRNSPNLSGLEILRSDRLDSARYVAPSARKYWQLIDELRARGKNQP